MNAWTLRMILGLAILFFFSAVHYIEAAEWIFYGETRSGHLYYDNISIKNNGDIARVRTMAIFNDDGKIELASALRKIGKASGNLDLLSHSITLEEVDCVNKKLKISTMTIFNEKGGSIHSPVIKSDEWDNIIPETNGDILWTIVCRGSK